MSSAIDKLDAEIARLQTEARTVEAAPPTIAERFAAVEGELRDAEGLFRAHGLKISAGHPAESAHLQRQSLIGAMMVAAGDKLATGRAPTYRAAGRRSLCGRQSAEAGRASAADPAHGRKT